MFSIEKLVEDDGFRPSLWDDKPIQKAADPIVSSRSVSVCDMSLLDWETLSWHTIRGVAKNRIAKGLRRGRPLDFVLVRYQKMPNEPTPGGPPRPKRWYAYAKGEGLIYKAAATEEDLEEIRQLGNQPDEDPSPDAEIIDDYVSELQLELLYDRAVILGLVSALKSAGVCSGLLNIIEGGIDNRNPVWAFVLIVALTTYLGFDRAFDEIEEQIDG